MQKKMNELTKGVSRVNLLEARIKDLEEKNIELEAEITELKHEKNEISSFSNEPINFDEYEPTFDDQNDQINYSFEDKEINETINELKNVNLESQIKTIFKPHEYFTARTSIHKIFTNKKNRIPISDFKDLLEELVSDFKLFKEEKVNRNKTVNVRYYYK
ncbi:hypothetical protein NBO_2g0051 [Nosema bombycis CQ1]|uniref:Uncharacterized protein n=1 Tax=Nosema bombycis (strain CQ1 / CVCC 102059) TaxID=578461 RepID=R0MC60_NOSB1|nr:hypothetical protein NBO_2g0051 [Nosema bombycis CQ1]|eukprot:EOB15559.1 hypothetical protein NBO_2g0051 [Nosema bombycis CQ1]